MYSFNYVQKSLNVNGWQFKGETLISHQIHAFQILLLERNQLKDNFCICILFNDILVCHNWMGEIFDILSMGRGSQCFRLGIKVRIKTVPKAHSHHLPSLQNITISFSFLFVFSSFYNILQTILFPCENNCLWTNYHLT